ncbi:hypothetical protein SteCoe_9844 [Stentor coeruleus]|uniref:Uncharacterized protein n=1 Tax=Stentor coeruleus TaxID=5963 RepID=A0A1R2CGV7_9CILI|nr:hypothetical protein SteCoe_9844 [Stentor coeruleus]
MKLNPKNLVEKIQAICENPFGFISYPISEDAALLFELNPESKCQKSLIFSLVPDLQVLQAKVVPFSMSQNKFNLILFLFCADYLPLEVEDLEETLSTIDSSQNEVKALEISSFMKSQMVVLNVSIEAYQELDDNLAKAFAEIEFEKSDGFFD